MEKQMTQETPQTGIHKAMLAAMDTLCRMGIGKNRKADAGAAKYNFRGIDDAITELSPILVRCGMTVEIDFTDLTITERVKGDPADGKATRFATVKGRFTFTAADGTSCTGGAYGEAADSGDKAVSKAQSVAFRTVLFDQFMVPLVGMDPESEFYDHGPEEVPGLDAARDKALDGTEAFRSYWKTLDAKTRTELGKYIPELEQAAKAADGAGK
jgi:hypothetical protein